MIAPLLSATRRTVSMPAAKVQVALNPHGRYNVRQGDIRCR